MFKAELIVIGGASMTINITTSFSMYSEHNVEDLLSGYLDGRISPHDKDLWETLDNISIGVTGSVTGFKLQTVDYIELIDNIWELVVTGKLLHLEGFENLSELEDLL